MALAFDSPVDLSWFEHARKTGTATDRALAFFDSLEPVSLDSMIGLWRGSGFETDHPLDGLLEAYGWYGKKFVDTETVHPLLFGKEGGKIVAVNPVFVPVGITTRINLRGDKILPALFRVVRPLLTTKKPRARLRQTEYRGKASATMIYDALPINDIFRRVTAETLLGLMDFRGFTHPFFFVLQRVPRT